MNQDMSRVRGVVYGISSATSDVVVLDRGHVAHIANPSPEALWTDLQTRLSTQLEERP